MSLTHFITFILLLIFPLIVGGVGHMIVVKKNWFISLRIPLNQKLFGANKTWRGFVVMPLLTLPAILLLYYLEIEGRIFPYGFSLINPWIGGICLGLAYAAFELPNSYLKRRLNIPPGQLPEDKKILFYLLDHIDSATGCLLTYYLIYQIPWWILLWVLPAGILIHTGINLILYKFKIRENPF